MDAAGQPTTASLLYSQAAGRFEGTVDRAGWVRGGAPGTIVAVVSAVQPGKAPVVQRVEVRVVPASPVRVVVEPSIRTLVVGQSLPLAAKGISSQGDASAAPVTWRSSNAAVARVNASGAVTAVAPGKTTLTAMVSGVSTAMPITVIGGVSRATLTPSSARVRQGDVVTMAFRATAGARNTLRSLAYLYDVGWQWTDRCRRPFCCLH